MNLYVDAYSADGKSILGNGEGQNVYPTERYTSPDACVSAIERQLGPGSLRPKYERVAYWLVVDRAGKEYARIDNDEYVPPLGFEVAPTREPRRRQVG